jgi:hypothetical protein
MHQQIKASPDTVAENIRAVVDALASAGINVESISPDFDPPHVRVLVEHEVFDDAFNALQNANLEPTIVRAVEPVQIPNKPGALRTAMDTLEGQGHIIESILVLAGRGKNTEVSFGVAGDVDNSWPGEAESLMALIQTEIKNLP